jgi:hypothetical protein
MANVILPAPDAEAITESNRPLDQAEGVQFEKQVPGRVFLMAGSGCYHFQIQSPVIGRDP